jgi:hypothetical protein
MALAFSTKDHPQWVYARLTIHGKEQKMEVMTAINKLFDPVFDAAILMVILEKRDTNDRNNNKISLSEELGKLNKMLEDGILSKEEFQQAKAKLLV